jgi:hypothetical protein
MGFPEQIAAQENPAIDRFTPGNRLPILDAG